MREKRNRGIAATPEELDKLNKAKAAKRNKKGKPWTQENLAEEAEVNVSTVKNLFARKKVDRSSAENIAQALGLDLFKIVDRDDPLTQETVSDKPIDWRAICRQNFPQQKQLTISSFTSAHGVAPELDKIYVPLALIERQPPKPSPKDKTEEKEEEKLIPIEEDFFFENVLRRGQSKNSQGRRIAIIGEPGSGKTTRLQKIADWILKEDLGLPIWISLADLTPRTEITHYIEEIWLKKTGKSIKIDELTQHKQQIWLLLDGLDEMTSRVEMRDVSALLRGWVEEARVVVTCRVNVWEADRNAFLGFDVFRNLPFELEQIETFIRCWFKEND